jgi:hypothetical protein
MTAFGVNNRRSGWKRERSDVVLDGLIKWAVTREALSSGPSLPIQTPSVRPANTATATLDLAALASSLGASAAPSPARAPRMQTHAEAEHLIPTDARSR